MGRRKACAKLADPPGHTWQTTALGSFIMTQVAPAPPSVPTKMLPVQPPGRRRGIAMQNTAAHLAARLSVRLATPPPKAMQIVVSPRVFCSLWVVIVLFQLVLSIALLRALYSNVWTLLDHEEIDVALRHFGVAYDGAVMVGTTLVTLGSIVVNLTDVVRYVQCSVRHRQLLFADPPTDKQATSRQGVTWMRSQLTQLWAPLTQLSRACGIHGTFFDVGLYTRELLEITLQTYQTHRVSYTVSEPWINNFAVGLVVANCWTTPLVDLALARDNEPLRRALCLTVDLLLDTLSALALPMLVFASYRSKLPHSDWYDPLWVMDTGNDLLYFHINTWLDLLSRTMPSVSLLHCLHSITPMLRRQPPPPPALVPAPKSALVVGIAPRPPIKSRVLATPRRRPRATVVHKLMLLYGAAIVAVGVLAQHGPQLSPVLTGCQQPMRPWLLATERFPCAVLELNCAAHPALNESDASDGSMDALLDRAERSALAALIITHCPRVRMPSRLAEFHNLVWLELYNSTLLAWPSSAALTQTLHPAMSTVLLVRVDVSALITPPNVLMERLVTGASVPASLGRVTIAATNLSTMAAVGDGAGPGRQRQLQALMLEDCGLRGLPVLTHTIHMTTLSLSRNPLDDGTGPTTALVATSLYAQATRLHNCSSVPPGTTTIFAAESPLCEAPTRPLVCGTAVVDCTTPRRHVPVARIDARRKHTQRRSDALDV